MGLGVVRRRESGVRVRRHGIARVGDHFAGSGLFHSDPHALFALLGYGAEASHRLRFVFHLIRCESVDRRRKNQIALSIYHSFVHSFIRSFILIVIVFGTNRTKHTATTAARKLRLLGHRGLRRFQRLQLLHCLLRCLVERLFRFQLADLDVNLATLVPMREFVKIEFAQRRERVHVHQQRLHHRFAPLTDLIVAVPNADIRDRILYFSRARSSQTPNVDVRGMRG